MIQTSFGLPIIPMISIILSIALYGLGMVALFYLIKALRIYIKKNN